MTTWVLATRMMLTGPLPCQGCREYGNSQWDSRDNGYLLPFFINHTSTVHTRQYRSAQQTAKKYASDDKKTQGARVWTISGILRVKHRDGNSLGIPTDISAGIG